MYICTMQNISFHIAYLLTRHECVIVPGLGAFVVSSFEREKSSRWGILSPPESFLGFNSEIKHNDGLLSNSIAREKKISFREANLLIEQYVTDVLQSLDEGKQVHIPWVGSLYSKDNKKLFQQGKTLSCNAFNYGLTSFSLPCLKDIKQKTDSFIPKKNKDVVWIPVSRKFITYTGSIAAALIAMCIIPTPLNNGHSDPANTQYASLVSFPTHTVNEEKEAVKAEMPIAAESSLKQEEPETPPSETINPVKEATHHYYIIIASLESETSAKKALSEFQSKGFENAAILSADGRHRIYTDCFEDKTEAEQFLLQFRINYPANVNAWLLSK